MESSRVSSSVRGSLLIPPAKKPGIRLLHVIRTTDLESGGPLEYLVQVTKIMIREGHKVEVVSLEPASAALDHHLPFPVTGLGCGLGRYGFNPGFVRWLRRNARRFDAVIVHGLWNYTSVGTRLALKRTGTPYLVFTHGMLDPWFNQAYRLKHLAKLIYWHVNERRVLRDARRVLFTCAEEMLRAKVGFTGHTYKERVVLFGTSRPPPALPSENKALALAHPRLHGRRYLLFVGRIHPVKGCDLLLQAFAQSIPYLPADVDLVMAGPDQCGLMRQLKALAGELKIAHRVHWPGMLSGNLKWAAFRSAEAMILPSHHENFGIVVAEAMACSTPVLISDKVNIWREVKASGGGLVSPDTAKGTSSAIREFFSLSAQENARMRTAARKGFDTYFDVEAAALDLLQTVQAHCKT